MLHVEGHLSVILTCVVDLVNAKASKAVVDY